MINKNYWIPLLKWGITGVILLSFAGFLYQTDMNAVGDGLHQVGHGFLWIVVVTFLAHLCGAVSWSYTIPSTVKIPFLWLFLIRFLGENIGLLNPVNIVGGDSFKAYMMEKQGVSYRIGFSSLIVSRIIMIFTQVGIFLIAALCYIFFAGDQAAQLFEIIMLSVLFIALLVTLLLFSGKVLQTYFFSRFYHFLERRGIVDKWAKLKKKISQYYAKERSRFYQSIVWSLVNFLIGSLEVWIIFHFLGIEISYLEALLIDQGVLFLKSFGAFIPSQIGVEEYFNKLMFAIVGITSISVWITASILRRVRQILWLVIGLIIYYAIFFRTKRDAVSIGTAS